MLKNRMTIVAVSLGILMMPLVGMGQPTLSGTLTGTLESGDYLVVGNCTVPAGESLVIEAGTTLSFSGQYYLLVYGQLNANGTAEDSIYFVRQYPTAENWHRGIRFQPGSSTENSLSYCWIDRGKNQNFPIYIGGALYVKDAGLTLSHCRITASKANTGGGLYAENSTVTISNCSFEADSAEMGAGVYAMGCPITISESEFYLNKCFNNGYGGGIFLNSCDPANVSYSILVGNSAVGT